MKTMRSKSELIERVAQLEYIIGVKDQHIAELNAELEKYRAVANKAEAEVFGIDNEPDDDEELERVIGETGLSADQAGIYLAIRKAVDPDEYGQTEKLTTPEPEPEPEPAPKQSPIKILSRIKAEEDYDDPDDDYDYDEDDGDGGLEFL